MVSAGGGVMVCEYYHDSLIDLLDRPVRMASGKIGAICLSELDEELWMG